MRTVCVTIHDRHGRQFTHVTMAKSLYESVANAVDWFNDPYWRGPKPRGDTIFDVLVTGDDRRWKVHAATVERWRQSGPGA